MKRKNSSGKTLLAKSAIEVDSTVEVLVRQIIERVADKWTMLVLEVLEEHGGLDELVERAPGLFEDRAQVREDLLGLSADLPAHQLLLPGEQRELAGDEDEAACLDRLRVRRPLERRGC